MGRRLEEVEGWGSPCLEGPNIPSLTLFRQHTHRCILAVGEDRWSSLLLPLSLSFSLCNCIFSYTAKSSVFEGRPHTHTHTHTAVEVCQVAAAVAEREREAFTVTDAVPNQLSAPPTNSSTALCLLPLTRRQTKESTFPFNITI